MGSSWPVHELWGLATRCVCVRACVHVLWGASYQESVCVSMHVCMCCWEPATRSVCVCVHVLLWPSNEQQFACGVWALHVLCGSYGAVES